MELCKVTWNRTTRCAFFQRRSTVETLNETPNPIPAGPEKQPFLNALSPVHWHVTKFSKHKTKKRIPVAGNCTRSYVQADKATGFTSSSSRELISVVVNDIVKQGASISISRKFGYSED